MFIIIYFLQPPPPNPVPIPIDNDFLLLLVAVVIFAIVNLFIDRKSKNDT